MQSIGFKKDGVDSFSLSIDNCPISFDLAQSAVNFAQQYLRECKEIAPDRVMMGFIVSLPNVFGITFGHQAQFCAAVDHWTVRLDGNKASACSRTGKPDILPSRVADVPVTSMHQFKDIEVKCSFATGTLSVDKTTERIVYAPPIFRKFLGRPYKALTHWLDKKGGYTETQVRIGLTRKVDTETQVIHGS